MYFFLSFYEVHSFRDVEEDLCVIRRSTPRSSSTPWLNERSDIESFSDRDDSIHEPFDRRVRPVVEGSDNDSDSRCKNIHELVETRG